MSKCSVWKKCYYGGTEGCQCRYSAITGRSRIAKNGKRDPNGEVVDGVCNYYAKRTKGNGATSYELTQELIRAERLKFQNNQSHKATWADKKKRMAEMHKQGVCDIEIFKRELHLSTTKAYQMATELSIHLLTNNYDNKYEKMRRMWLDGASDREIAAEFGVTVRTVQKWRHDNSMQPNLKQEERGQKP